MFPKLEASCVLSLFLSCCYLLYPSFPLVFVCSFFFLFFISLHSFYFALSCLSMIPMLRSIFVHSLFHLNSLLSTLGSFSFFSLKVELPLSFCFVPTPFCVAVFLCSSFIYSVKGSLNSSTITRRLRSIHQSFIL
ncbi:MAG: hypothetical protein J3R72DRAFT_452828, partial [Linnemannia gamsii]